MSKNVSKLAIIIPCYNEELAIESTVKTLLGVLDNLVEKEKISGFIKRRTRKQEKIGRS